MRKIKLIGENYDVLLEEGKKVVTIINIGKDGVAFGKNFRMWKSFEYVVEYYKGYDFVEETK